MISFTDDLYPFRHPFWVLENLGRLRLLFMKMFYLNISFIYISRSKSSDSEKQRN